MPVLSVLGWVFIAITSIIGLLVFLEKRFAAKEYLLYGGDGWTVKDRVVIVTGASSGIGEEMAKQCAKAGAHVVLAARRLDKLTAVAAECKSAGAASVMTLACDVSLEKDCKSLCEQTAKAHNGVIDVVFANAGLSMAGTLESQSDLTIYSTLMATNFFGVLWTIAYALPFLKKARNGKIMIVSSVAGRVATPGRTGYHASKYALHGLGDSLRQELAPHGISVLMVCPGPVKTDINSTRLGSAGKDVEIDMEKAMPVEQCVSMTLSAAARHERVEMFVPLMRLGPILGSMLPRVTEAIAAWKQAQIHKGGKSH